MIADRAGLTTGFALENLQRRGVMFVGIGEAVYEGMVVGETSRGDEMLVNPTRPKELTNIRTHDHDEAVRLTPARHPTLETAIEWIAEDELVEVTPAAVRIRKRYLGEAERRLARKR
jgi:GTP-binding protein